MTITLAPTFDLTYHLDKVEMHEINRVKSKHIEPSGKGINVSINLAEEGHKTTAIAPIPDSPLGNLWIEMAEEKFDVRTSETSKEIRINTSVVDAQAVTKLNEKAAELTEAEIVDLMQVVRTEAQATKPEWIALCGSVHTSNADRIGQELKKIVDETTVRFPEEGEEVAEEAAAAPTDVEGFIAWFEELKASGPGQYDALFPWLAEEANLDQLRWFFEQEAAGEAGFDDLVAMTQVKLPTLPKLELARNYWDEMGRGNAKGMHGPMLDALVETLAVNPVIENTLWQSLALANAMTAMATNRRYAWQSVGALGVIELTAPDRSAATAKGLRRLGFSDKERRYFDLHAVLDIKHSEDWNREAIRPAVEEDPRRATAMAEGALIRLKCGERCFEAYRAVLMG